MLRLAGLFLRPLCPQGFHHQFVLVAFKCLPRALFIQYVDRGIVQLSEDSVSEILAQQKSSSKGSVVSSITAANANHSEGQSSSSGNDSKSKSKSESDDGQVFSYQLARHLPPESLKKFVDAEVR